MNATKLNATTAFSKTRAGFKSMKLWTYQPLFVWRRLQVEGSYRPRWANVKSNSPEWCIAYDWMIQQMRRRRLQHNTAPPVWAWHSWEGFNRAPNQECADALYGWAEGNFVCLELSIRHQQFLLSDYLVWNDIISAAFDAYKANRSPSISTDQEHQLFDIERLKDEEPEYIEIQACLPVIYRRDVVRVVEINLTGDTEN